MKHADFKHQLAQLDESVWQAILSGSSLCLQDDQQLVLYKGLHRNTIIFSSRDASQDITTLRTESLANSDEFLEDYYRTHPLTETGFEQQVLALIVLHGAEAFCTVSGGTPERTLFVEVGEVMAESTDSPRHRYGAYCELEHELSDEKLEAFVRNWVSSGEAYEQYIGMNVCRYGCAG